MARKPSQRSSRHKADEELNLTPMIDVLITMMFFLLMFANIMPLAIIDAPLPKVAETAEEVRKAKESDNKLELTVRLTTTGLVASTSGGTKQFALNEKGEYPYKEFHQFLVGLHTQMPNTKEMTLIPDDAVKYDTIIRVMDAARELTKEDPGYQAVPPEIAQKQESLQFNRLFPDVSLGGV